MEQFCCFTVIFQVLLLPLTSSELCELSMMTSWVTSDLILRLLGAVGVGGGQQGQAGKSHFGKASLCTKSKASHFSPDNTSS